MDVDRSCKRASRYKSRPCLVYHRDHENRPCRTQAARSGDGPQRGGGLRCPVRSCAARRLSCGELWSSISALIHWGILRRSRAAAVCRLRPRIAVACPSRGSRSNAVRSPVPGDLLADELEGPNAVFGLFGGGGEQTK